jgi:hypothetical protein
VVALVCDTRHSRALIVTYIPLSIRVLEWTTTQDQANPDLDYTIAHTQPVVKNILTGALCTLLRCESR